MRQILFIGVCFIFSVLFITCKDETTQASISFNGITETNSTGPDPVGKIDPDDWRPMMDCSVNSICTKIFPVYPNPANGEFNIVCSLNDIDSVVITLNSTPTNVVKEIFRGHRVNGIHIFSVYVTDLQPAIYRVYIIVFRQSGVLNSYGDVQIIN